MGGVNIGGTIYVAGGITPGSSVTSNPGGGFTVSQHSHNDSSLGASGLGGGAIAGIIVGAVALVVVVVLCAKKKQQQAPPEDAIEGAPSSSKLDAVV